MTAKSSAPEPDVRAMLLHLVWLTFPARSIAPDLRVEIAWGTPDSGPNRSCTYGIGELDGAVGFAAWINGKGCNVYVGATLKRADTPHKRRTRAEHAMLATCLPVDFDNRFVEGASRLAGVAKPQLLVLTGRLPESRGQVFVRIGATNDLAGWDQLHARVVHYCGGDENARGRNRLMRLAGTISYPSPEKVGRGYVIERTSAHFVPAPEYSVKDLLAAFPPVAPSPVVTPPQPVRKSLGPPLTGRPARRKLPISSVQRALSALPACYAVEHRLWIRVGFALHDFDDGQRGLDLWQRFSHRCPGKAAETDFPYLWDRFNSGNTGRRITIGWLLREARRPLPLA